MKPVVDCMKPVVDCMKPVVDCMKPIVDYINQPHCNFWNRINTLLLEDTKFMDCRSIESSITLLI